MEAILILDHSAKINSKVSESSLHRQYTVIQPNTEIDILHSISRYTIRLVLIDSEHKGTVEYDEYFKKYHPQIPLLYVRSSRNANKVMNHDSSIPLDDLVPRIKMLMNKVDHFSPRNLRYYDPLSFQEERILRLLEKGYSNKQIAELLRLKEATVKTYNYVLYQKLAVNNRTQAVITAKERGII